MPLLLLCQGKSSKLFFCAFTMTTNERKSELVIKKLSYKKSFAYAPTAINNFQNKLPNSIIFTLVWQVIFLFHALKRF